MLRKEISDNYFAVKLTFEEPPIGGSSLKEFLYTSEQLIYLLSAFFWQYEILMPKIEYDPNRSVPIKLSNPTDWQDLALLLKQAEGEERRRVEEKPGVIADIGGRKIIVKVPSDRFFSDHGEMPFYACEFTSDEHSHTLTVSTSSVAELDKALIINEKGENPVDGRLGYKKIYSQMADFYKEPLQDVAIAKEMRSLLKGNKLSVGHCPVLPALTAALFAAEVSRNRNCFVSGLMWLDLIEFNARYAFRNDLPYTWKNSLWHPALYGLARKEDQLAENITLAKIGGLHPMTHMDSYKEEFKVSPYDTKLLWSNMKSLIILIDWLNCYTPFKTYFGATIVPLNKEQYEKAKGQQPGDVLEKGGQIKSMALAYAVGSCIAERQKSFEMMLPNKTLSLSDTPLQPEPTQDERRRFSAQHTITFLQQKPMYRLPKIEDSDANLAPLDLIKKIDPSFTEMDLKFCLSGSDLSGNEIYKLIHRLLQPKEPIDFNNLLLQFDRECNQHKFLYKLIISSRLLFDEFSKFHEKTSSFLITMGRVHGLRVGPTDFTDDITLDALRSAPNQYVFNKLKPEDFMALCKASTRFFVWLLLEKRDLASSVLTKFAPFEITELLIQSKGSFSDEQLQRLSEMNYKDHSNYGMNFSIGLGILRKEAGKLEARQLRV